MTFLKTPPLAQIPPTSTLFPKTPRILFALEPSLGILNPNWEKLVYSR